MVINSKLRNLNWDKLKYFYYVAKCGSFTKASVYLNLSQPSLSRTIQALELQLEMRLFERTVRGLLLTEQGSGLLLAISHLFENLESEFIHLYENDKEPCGHIRIRTTASMLNDYLLSHIPTFQRMYPNISLSLTADDVIPKFDLNETDVAIRPFIRDNQHLLQYPLLKSQVRLYASQEYLQEFGTPKTLSDLGHHRLIGFGDRPESEDFIDYNWHLIQNCSNQSLRPAFIKVNTPQGSLRLAQASMGIATLTADHPDLIASNLVEVLSDYPGTDIDIYYIYAVRLKSAKRIEVLCQFLQSCFIQSQSIFVDSIAV